MSVAVRTPECFGSESGLLRDMADFFGDGPIELEPDHAACPGGWHLDGLIGGWHCPCPCHNRVDGGEALEAS